MTKKKTFKTSSESIVRQIRRKIRRKFTAEEKIRIVLDGLRGEESITDLSRKEGIHPTMYYKWSKSFLEAGKRQLNGDTIREASSNEVKELVSFQLNLDHTGEQLSDFGEGKPVPVRSGTYTSKALRRNGIISPRLRLSD